MAVIPSSRTAFRMPDDKRVREHISMYHRYKLVTEIGKGTHCKVYRSGDTAIKLSNPGSIAFRSCQAEVEWLHLLKEKAIPHIVKLKKSIPLYTPWCTRHLTVEAFGGFSLEKLIDQEWNQTSTVFGIATQLLETLDSLQKEGIIHNDLRLSNLLYKNRGRQLQVIDFGLTSFARDMTPDKQVQTLPYRAPEVTLGLPGDCSLDMWSFGCILYELYTGSRLFPLERDEEGNVDREAIDHIFLIRARFPQLITRCYVSRGIHFGKLFFDDPTHGITLKPHSSYLESIRDWREVVRKKARKRGDSAPLADSLISLIDQIMGKADRITPAQALSQITLLQESIKPRGTKRKSGA